jgi:Fibronectin type III domain
MRKGVLLSAVLASLLVSTFAAPTPVHAALGVQLISSSQWGPDSAGFIHIVGEVANSGTQDANFIELDFNLYNAAGTLLATDFTFTLVDILAPDERSPFDEIFTPQPGYDHYSITISPASTTSQPNHNFNTKVTNTFTDSVGFQHIVGTVTNNNVTADTFVEVIFTFYDCTGKTVAADFTFINLSPPTLGPSPASASFELIRIPGAPAYVGAVVLAQSTDPPSPYAIPAPAVVATTPGPPTNVMAVADIGSAVVSWVAPACAGGSPITGYTITSSPGSVTTTAAANATSATVPALSNGTAYTFTVLAANAVGPGPASTPSNSVTPIPAPPPGTPTNVVALAGEASAAVYWVPTGTAPITSYTVTASPGGATASPIGSQTSAVVSGLTDGTTYTFTVTATNTSGTSPSSAPSNAVVPGRGAYQALAPARILDTRFGTGGVPIAPLGPGGTLNVQITGQGGVPATGVSAVVLNVTVTNTTAASYLTIYPAGVPRPLASNLNWVSGKTVPNLVQVALGLNGQVTVYNGLGSADVIFDVAGSVATPTVTPPLAGLYNPVVPNRILDTRNGTGAPAAPVGPAQTISVLVAGTPNIPSSGVAAVVLNVTATGPTAPSYLTVFPTGTSPPTASNLNFVAGQTVPNRVIVKVGTNAQTSTAGWVSIYNALGSVNVIADVVGWFTDGTAAAGGSMFVGVTPARILDTRMTHNLGSSATLILPVAGQGGVPAMSAPVAPTAVVLNVTVTNPTAASFLTAWPDGATQPLASDLNYLAGLTVPNLVVVKLGTNGSIDLYNAFGTTDVIVDVVGWYG